MLEWVPRVLACLKTGQAWPVKSGEWDCGQRQNNLDLCDLHFRLVIVLGRTNHYEAASDGGELDLQRAGHAPNGGGVRAPVRQFRETADFLEQLA